jgi:methyl-accepting chemotaxis protein
MTASSQEVANSAAHAAQASTEADHNTRIGGQVIEAAVSSIEGLAQEVATAAEAIQRVEGDSNNIGAILDVIRGIADQTNLLALNAAIEAARAGEQGRGFAVVADEVRTLAMRTQESTQEIQAMIETLQQGTGVAVKAMESSHQRSAETVEQASKAGETFESIARAVGTISDMNTQIASAAEEQTAVTEDISRSLSGINDVLARSVHGATEAAASSEQVAGLAGDMQAITRNFQV